jgi:large subunit ribosomal protein L14e
MLKYLLDSLVTRFKEEAKDTPAVEVGRICMKIAGRETGKKCVIVDVMDKSFVLVTGPKKVTGIKRKRVNLNHITVLQEKLDLKRGASDEEVTSVLESAGKLQEMTQPAKPAV